MTLNINSVAFDTLTADPASPTEGQAWYNDTINRFSIFRDGAIRRFSDLAELQAHIADTANPHEVTLEQARSEGNVLAGPVDMGGNLITNVATPVALTDAANAGYVSDQIAQKIQGLDWQESVLDKDLATPPGTPAVDDRYIVAAGGTGAWAGQDDNVATWDGTAWVFAVPNEGFMTRVMDENIFYLHDGTAWGSFESVTDHGALTGLTDDDHTQYTRADGTRAFTGDVDMGGFAVTNVGNVDGVDVSAHAARHASGGADEIDGDALDIDYVPPVAGYVPDVSPAEVTSTAQLTAHLAGIASALVAAGAALATKAGSVPAASFSGTPLQATVAFASAFSAVPSVTLTPEVSGSRRFNANQLTVTTTGFTIDLGTADSTDLVSVKWVATEVGESA